MCDYFKDEPECQSIILPALNDIFWCYEPLLLPDIAPGLIGGGRKSKGHTDGPNQVMETVVGFMNKSGSG